MPSLACPLPSCAIVPGAAARFGAVAAIGGQIHTGLDLVAAYGTIVRAPAAGIVRRTWYEAQGGRVLALTHSDQLETRYAHLSRVAVRAGQTVAAGDVIAATGASGLVTGPHLHFEVLVSGQYVDPAPYLFDASGTATMTAPADRPAAFPRDKGMACPAGYAAGTVNPQAWGWLPGSPWFARPTNPDGTVDACVRAGVAPGTNAALADVGSAVVQTVVPVALNLGVIGLSLGLAIAGVRRILAA